MWLGRELQREVVAHERAPSPQVRSLGSECGRVRRPEAVGRSVMEEEPEHLPGAAHEEIR